MSKNKLWSVTRITNPMHPGITVRVGEVVKGGVLQAFRWLDGRQTCRSLKCRRVDLGSTLKQQREEARKIGCQYIEQLMKPAPEAPKAGTPLTFSRLIEKYEADAFAGRTANYKRDAVSSIRRIATFVGNDMALTALKPSDLQKYYAARAAENHAPAGRGDIVALKIACRWAWRNGLLEVSPFTKPQFDKVIPQQDPQRRPIAKKGRYEQIKAVARKLPPAFEVLLDLAWETGKSIAGIRKLRWEDVSLTSTKEAPHGMVTWYADRAKETTDSKKRRRHTRPINAAASAALRRWQQSSGSIGGAFVFPSISDPKKPLDYPTCKKWMRKAENLAKVPHFKQGVWHPYRRGWAYARKDKFSPAELAAANDWRDSSMVVLYQAADEEGALEAATHVA